MRFVLKLTQVGDSVGLALPEELLAVLKPKSDVIYLAQSSAGYCLTADNPEAGDQPTNPGLLKA